MTYTQTPLPLISCSEALLPKLTPQTRPRLLRIGLGVGFRQVFQRTQNSRENVDLNRLLTLRFVLEANHSDARFVNFGIN
jgi:hypothetical protein